MKMIQPIVINSVEGLEADSELLTVRQVAKMLQLEEKTIRQMIKDGVIEAGRIGHCWRIRKSNIMNAFPEDLLTPAEAADILKLNEDQVLDLIEKKAVKAGKIGDFYRIRLSAIMDQIPE